MPSSPKLTVLHYTGYSHEQGGIVAVIRSLRDAGGFEVVHGVAPGGAAPGLPQWIGPAIAGEEITVRNFWRARVVARAAQAWLRESPNRIFHGHSRAGLLVACWLHWLGEARVVASVHCYGRQRWFYRWAASQLGERLYWLSPAMRHYYGVAGAGWAQCLPGGVAVPNVPLRPATPQAGRLRLGGAGFLVPWKRWDLVLEAMAQLPADLRGGVTFQHIGATANGTSGDHAAFLCELTTRHGLDRTVLWRGAEPSSRRLLQEIDVLVVPSHQEPYATILQEALAAGIPVFAADSGGSCDVVRAGENGWLFADGEPQALANLLTDQLRTGAWALLDRATIRQGARPASVAAAEWAEVYARL